MADYKIKKVMLIFTDLSDTVAGVQMDYTPAPPPGETLPDSVYDQPCVAVAASVLAALEREAHAGTRNADDTPSTTIFPGMRPLK